MFPGPTIHHRVAMFRTHTRLLSQDGLAYFLEPAHNMRIYVLRISDLYYIQLILRDEIRDNQSNLDFSG